MLIGHFGSGETYELAPDGSIVLRIHRYVELATGLNHLVNGQYVPSSDQIELSADGTSASATNGQHQAYFPADIANGVIELVTPDGKTLESQPIGRAIRRQQQRVSCHAHQLNRRDSAFGQSGDIHQCLLWSPRRFALYLHKSRFRTRRHIAAATSATGVPSA